MEMFLKLEDLFESIKNFRYFVTKIETPFFNDKFPKEYPIGRDVDIICHKEDFPKIVQISDELIHAEANYSKHVIHDSDDQTRFRIQTPRYYIRLNPMPYDKLINGHPMTKLYFQVDISTINEKDFRVFKKDFLDSLFTDFSIRNGVKVLNPKAEAALRMMFWKNSPKSTHHLDYISENVSIEMLQNIQDQEFKIWCENILERIL